MPPIYTTISSASSTRIRTDKGADRSTKETAKETAPLTGPPPKEKRDKAKKRQDDIDADVSVFREYANKLAATLVVEYDLDHTISKNVLTISTTVKFSSASSLVARARGSVALDCRRTRISSASFPSPNYLPAGIAYHSNLHRVMEETSHKLHGNYLRVGSKSIAVTLMARVKDSLCLSNTSARMKTEGA